MKNIKHFFLISIIISLFTGCNLSPEVSYNYWIYDNITNEYSKVTTLRPLNEQEMKELNLIAQLPENANISSKETKLEK